MCWAVDRLAGVDAMMASRAGIGQRADCVDGSEDGGQVWDPWKGGRRTESTTRQHEHGWPADPDACWCLPAHLSAFWRAPYLRPLLRTVFEPHFSCESLLLQQRQRQRRTASRQDGAGVRSAMSRLTLFGTLRCSCNMLLVEIGVDGRLHD